MSVSLFKDTEVVPSGMEVTPGSKKVKCSCKTCCVRPSECKARVKDDIAGEPGPISRCYKRWEVFENILSVTTVSLLGISFFFSWVILQTTTFSFGQPMPMHVPGGCSKFFPSTFHTFFTSSPLMSYIIFLKILSPIVANRQPLFFF